MQIFPAIDLRNGEVVRLIQGDYDRMDVYAKDPVEIALQFRAQGAQNLHVVDLDGAKDGRLVNEQAVRRIVKDSGLFVEIGGGIRDEERILRYLDAGVGRVILGTVAVENYAFVEDMVYRYGDKIAVSVDARDQKIAIKGWKEITEIDSVAFCSRLADTGVQTIIYTDISKDGGLQGTNLDIYRVLSARVKADIVASGGISYMQEIASLREMGLYGAILGKVLYENKLSLKEVLAESRKGNGSC
ncbi:MAG TPA: 1-(5-phosphoribosyl)-5-[(5-phosphoribosylamino)methylideneamino]imidazole-4-carboxamide isomerase [Firmicutes bacterium]|nr:1-(5-phosphoribosyl)-5-[(5-phosphoribosylamino)methylideneamino]imidazole-4-carboxamide isomerase [Bacillota bacterium]